MKKLLLLFCGLSLLLISCSSDEDSTSSSEDTSILPKTISYLYPSVLLGTNSISTLSYNGNKIVSSIENGSKTIFTYDGNVITKQEKFDVDQQGKETKDTEVAYTYENGKLKSRVIKEVFSAAYPNSQYIEKTVYTHTSDVLISYINYSVNVDTNLESKTSQGNLTYKDGNLIKSQETEGASTSTRIYEYDTKKNPLKNILGFNLLLNEISEFGNNNVTKTTITSSDFPTPRDYLTAYIYNDNGFPTKYTSYTGGGSVEYEIEYTY